MSHSRQLRRICAFVSALLVGWIGLAARGEDWPGWRGPGGLGVSAEKALPTRWSKTENVVWSTEIPGEGSSSPIVWGERVFVTSSRLRGEKRLLHSLDRRTGKIIWTSELADHNPETTSSVTGHAAATPATDGQQVVVSFGNAGAASFDFAGRLVWRRRLGEFESELGLASSPVIHGGRSFLLCDHDGSPPRSFHSFFLALDLKTGEPVWKTNRAGLFRSWSTPLIVPAPDGKRELIVSGQGELRAYEPESGKLLWHVSGLTDWVSPTPVFGGGLLFATCGKDGSTLAVRPGGRGDVTKSHVVWRVDRGGPYVCSPLYYDGRLYVHTERGQLTCYDGPTGRADYQVRLGGKFTASAIAAAGHLYFSNEDGDCHLIRAGPKFYLVAVNRLEEACYASPAASNCCLFVRTEKRLYCLRGS